MKIFVQGPVWIWVDGYGGTQATTFNPCQVRRLSEHLSRYGSGVAAVLDAYILTSLGQIEVHLKSEVQIKDHSIDIRSERCDLFADLRAHNSRS